MCCYLKNGIETLLCYSEDRFIIFDMPIATENKAKEYLIPQELFKLE